MLFFPNVPLYALTATAAGHDRKMIITTLCMKDVKNIVGNIDRPNIFIEKQFSGGSDKTEGKLPFDHNLSVITVVWICI